MIGRDPVLNGHIAEHRRRRLIGTTHRKRLANESRPLYDMVRNTPGLYRDFISTLLEAQTGRELVDIARSTIQHVAAHGHAGEGRGIRLRELHIATHSPSVRLSA
ncbi:hypothetical protein [Gemmatimonas sp.]|uniref:hypothetical protein n=1 Tax=Gemmatimonas sp. TaxID=1962908 RepID=UPI003F726435